MGFIRKNFLGGAEEAAAKRQEEAARAGQELVGQQFERTQQQLDPFIQGGLDAFQRQQELAGGLQDFTTPVLETGPTPVEFEATPGIETFAESPATAFLREQGLRGINQAAAATGGLGGGERLKELTRFSQGLALQDVGRQQAQAEREAIRRQQLAQQQAQQQLGFAERQQGFQELQNQARRATQLANLQSLQNLTGVGLGAAGSLAGFGQQTGLSQANLQGQIGAAQGAQETAGPGAIRNLLGQGIGLAATGFNPFAGLTSGLFNRPQAQRTGGLSGQLSNSPATAFNNPFFTQARA